MIVRALRSFLAEPRVPGAPGPLRRDWVLVAVLIVVGLLEATLRDDLRWPGVVVLAFVVPAVGLPWRRVRPVLVTAAILGATAAGDAVMRVRFGESTEFVTAVYGVLLPYALFRWGSGVEAATGAALILAWHSISEAAGGGAGDWALGVAILLFLAALGASMRFRISTRLGAAERIRLRERELLARELHDTVAHHVSAIAIRAQAGRSLAASRPAAAVEALEVIEEAASRTLNDMRSLVGALRSGDEAELEPQGGIEDLERLARGPLGGLSVEVRLSSDLDGLPPLVSAAIYRIAQEAITNAARHARRATRVDVRVVGEPDCVRLTVRDDGEAMGSIVDDGEPGYGLIGMTERAALLGGTLEAGPDQGGGWTVTAVLPRSGAAR